MALPTRFPKRPTSWSQPGGYTPIVIGLDIIRKASRAPGSNMAKRADDFSVNSRP